MRVSGDVSGGFAELRVTLDNRFCGLVSYITGQIAQATSADAEMLLEVLGNTIATVVDAGLVVAISSLISGSEVARTFAPTPLILPGGPQVPNVRARMLNVDGDLFFLETLIYLFDIRVRELTPMGGLLFARGAT